MPLTKGIRPLSVAVLGFDGINALEFTGAFEVLTSARPEEPQENGRPCYSVKVMGVSGKRFISESGMILKADATLADLTRVDTLVVPGGAGIRTGETNRKVADWLVVHGRDLRRIVCVSTGIFPVARSGLLDGRKVTTHWRFAQDLLRRFPKLQVDAASSFVKDGPFYSCGGGIAPLEMVLALIDEDYGSRVALGVAREMVMRLRPPADRQNSVDPTQFDCGPMDRLAELPSWISAHLNADLSVQALADRTCLCPRHFSRVFRNAFHATPAAFVEQVRLDEARRLLLLPRNRIENVARAVGFKNAVSFRRAFHRRHGLSPTDYQRHLHVRGGRHAIPTGLTQFPEQALTDQRESRRSLAQSR